jgi:hypothetical protein
VTCNGAGLDDDGVPDLAPARPGWSTSFCYEEIGLLAELRLVIDHRHDSTVFINLREPGRHNNAQIEPIGTSPLLPTDSPTIIWPSERSSGPANPGQRSHPGQH